MGNRYGLEIRAAGGADAAGLVALLAQAGMEIPAQTVGARLDALAGAGAGALVAVEWGPPSGLVALQVCRGLDGPAFALITALVVAPHARRRGIGRLLLKAAARSARQAGCDRVLLAPGDRADLAAFAAATGFAPAGGLLARPLLRRGAAEG